MPLLLAAAAASCSYNRTPTSAAIPSPVVAQVAGTWSGPVTLQSVSSPMGGALECVGAGLAKVLQGTDTATMFVKQSGADLTANITSQGSGLACNYTGTAGPGNMVLNAKACDAPTIVVRCADTGAASNVQLIGTTITASVTPGVASGVVSNTYNVFDSDGHPTGGLTATSSLSAVRQ